jgi:hypothetical protein
MAGWGEPAVSAIECGNNFDISIINGGKSTMKFLAHLLIVACLSFAAGNAAARTTIQASSMTNPAPSEAFDQFDHFDIKPIRMDAPFAGQSKNEAAVKKIQENLDLRLNPAITGWNSAVANNTAPRVLLIEPRVEAIKFISGGPRFWIGPLAGNSGVLIKVKFTDAATGQVIAEPEFYQHANAWGGAMSVGGTDNAMLVREGALIADYIKDNYTHAVGGRTGVEDASDLKKQ